MSYYSIFQVDRLSYSISRVPAAKLFLATRSPSHPRPLGWEGGELVSVSLGLRLFTVRQIFPSYGEGHTWRVGSLFFHLPHVWDATHPARENPTIHCTSWSFETEAFKGPAGSILALHCPYWRSASPAGVHRVHGSSWRLLRWCPVGRDWRHTWGS